MTLLTMAHFFAKFFILMLADFLTPLFNYASHSSLLSGDWIRSSKLLIGRGLGRVSASRNHARITPRARGIHRKVFISRPNCSGLRLPANEEQPATPAIEGFGS